MRGFRIGVVGGKTSLGGRVKQWRRGWNLFKSKAVSLKVDKNTKTLILEKRRKIGLTECDVRNAENISCGIFHPYNHVCIFASVHGLLEYARIFGFEYILGR